mgnify:CR=1 FL=1
MTTKELHSRALDFAKRMCFKGYSNLTEARRQKLWSDAEWFLTDCFEQGCTSWDHDKPKGGMYPCDWIMERFAEKYFPNTARWDKKFEAGEEPRYFSLLNAICRSAIDIFDEFAGGVWGWTIADFKRMYDGELPEWFPRGDWQLIGNGLIPFSTMTDESSIAI